MPVILGKQNVMKVYDDAAERSWVVPTFCAENQTTIEAILAACEARAEQLGTRIPITIAMTGRYAHRAQAKFYAASRNPITGLQLFLSDCEILARTQGDYPHVDVLTHFDHGQPDDDADVWAGDLSRFSSVMFDGSALPWEENLTRTAEFVATRGDEVLIEGAADEILDANNGVTAMLTSPERAEEFVRRTGVDMVVANLGTEHRASAAELGYHRETARAIRDRIGTQLVLHGTSSVPVEQLVNLYKDGVCKVNIWTILERNASALLLTAMVENADSVAGPVAARLADLGLLGPNAPIAGGPDIGFFTTTWRNAIGYESMKHTVSSYLELWYR